MITKEQLFEAQPGDKFYIEVTIDLITKADYMSVDGAWVQHPLHPKNEYGCIFVTADDLIPIPETPLEEREPYSVQLRQETTVDDTYPYCAVIDDYGNEAARFYCEQYEAGKARAAAEAECARLNAEYRKEANQ